MPIIDIQKRLAPAGEIRPGHQVLTGGKRKDGSPATRPEKLENWRFTSRNKKALDAIAGLYGGTVAEWKDAPTAGQWELLSESSEIDVVVPPEAVAFSQWMELWDGGGCKRRCDGVTEQTSQGPCLCDAEAQDCKPMTRLSLMLAGIPTTGLWRVVSTGHNAKSELAGAMDLAQLLTQATGRSMLPAKLRLEHRKQIKDGQTRQFVVPTLDYSVDMAALATGNVAAISNEAPQLQAGTRGDLTPVPMDDTPAPSLPDQLTAMDSTEPKAKRAGTTTIPATGIRPRTAKQAEAGERPQQSESVDPGKNHGGSSVRSTNKLRMSLRDIGVTDDKEVHDVVSAYVGRPIASLKDLTQAEASMAIKAADAVEVAS